MESNTNREVQTQPYESQMFCVRSVGADTDVSAGLKRADNWTFPALCTLPAVRSLLSILFSEPHSISGEIFTAYLICTITKQSFKFDPLFNFVSCECAPNDGLGFGRLPASVSGL